MQSLNTGVVIIGGGPAGLACAMQLARYGIDALVFEKDETGGLLKNANLVENYPGFPGGIKGTELMKLIREQVEKHGIKTIRDQITSLQYENEMFVAQSRQYTIKGKFAVIASGTRPKPFGDFNIPDEAMQQIHYEVYGLLQSKNRRIGILGAGDAAFDYALNLSRKNEVMIFNRTLKIKALPLLVERAGQNERISYFEDHKPVKIEYVGEGIKMIFNHEGKEFEFYFNELIFALGREPQLEFISPAMALKLEYLRKQKKLFMTGDVINGEARQLSIATGDGIKCAMMLKDLI